MTLLSHYTNRAGFEGIAKSKAFWATNFMDLNDSSEFFYGWNFINRAAASMVMELIPSEKLRVGFQVEDFCKDSTTHIKQLFQSMNGYSNLYVVSFARGKNEDHNARGIRTLWELYNGHKGYCLQFDQKDLKRILELESSRASYEWVGMADVKYGIDQSENSFQDLCSQLSQHYLLQIVRAIPDIQVEPKIDRMWASSYFNRKLLEFCATHKDPCFEDEREMRIYAYPSSKTEARVFTGIAFKKTIRTTPNGKKYIIVGEGWTPGISPKRVIIGTKADLNISSILGNYNPHPQVALSNMPIS